MITQRLKVTVNCLFGFRKVEASNKRNQIIENYGAALRLLYCLLTLFEHAYHFYCDVTMCDCLISNAVEARELENQKKTKN